MSLLKAFVCQVFGFVLYNYLSEPLLEAKILPENIANPVLAATIAFLCFLLQLYTDNSDDLDDYVTTPSRSRRRRTSDKTGASDFPSANRFSRTGMPEPTFFRMDVRETVMSGPTIDELIYKMAAVERVLEQTAQSARADNIFAMPDIISVEKEVHITNQNNAECEHDVDATKPDIIAAEIHVEIASNGKAVEEQKDEEEEEQNEVEEQSSDKEVESEEEIEDTEEEEHETKSDNAQDACEDEEEEDEDEVTVIDASNKSKEKRTVKLSTTDMTESEEEDESNVEEKEKKEETKDESEEEEESE